ncbi:MAG: imidazole glycerol phosphate synthase subunit HisF [Myxococcota bacterium]
MATRRIIPCLDVAHGRVVKGIQFQGLRDAGDPVDLSQAYEAQGADELVILDVAATPEGRGHAVRTVEAVRAALRIPLTVGGGLRTVDDARQLLEVGADKVAVNTAAVRRPELLGELAEAFGVQCVVLAIDAARARDEAPTDSGYEVVVRSGKERTGRDVVQWAIQAVEQGAGEILLTSWDRDGTRSGYELPLLKAVSSAVNVPVIASGGADTIQHLDEAVQAGADAVLAASIFHDGQSTVADVKAALIERGLEIRP